MLEKLEDAGALLVFSRDARARVTLRLRSSA